MPIFPRSGSRELQNVLNWERRFNVELNTAKNTGRKKKVQMKVVENLISEKESVGAHVNLPSIGAKGLKRLSCLKYYYVLKC